MYGYLRLDAKANKRLFQYWKANYCYLCRTIENQYGEKSRFALSYDITFLGVLLKRGDFFDGQKIHCFGHKKSFNDPDYQKLAAIDLMLAYEMILDKKYDDNAAWAKVAEKSFRRQKAKIAKEFPQIHDKIHDFYLNFRRLEQQGADAKTLADSFSAMMGDLGQNVLCLERDRLNVLISVARWIYLIDALDDLDKDIKSGQFNPLKTLAGSAKDYLLNKQDHWKGLYQWIFLPAELNDTDISTVTIRRVIHYSIPLKTAEIMERILA